MDELKQDNQLEHTYSSYVRIRDVALKTCQEAMNDWKKWRERVRDIRASRHDMIMMISTYMNILA